MPLYEYVCRSCAHPFEELVFGDKTPACPACQHPEVERVMSGFAIGRGGASASARVEGGCGRCGDPRGPGACALDG